MNLSRPLRFCFFAIPVVTFVLLLLNCAVNVPFQDDYDAIMGWLSEYLKTASSGSKVEMLISQQTEHRVLIIHLATLLLHYCFGAINFKILVLLGNAFLAMTLILLFVSFRPKEQRDWLFLPVVYILLQPQYYEMLFWSTASLAYYPVVFFALLSFYLFDREGKLHFSLALLAAVIASFTLSSGVLALGLGIMICLLNKSYLRALVVVLVATLTICLFFSSYNAVSTSPQRVLDATKLRAVGEYFLNWIGSVPALSQPNRSAMAGACLLGFYLILIFIRYDKRNRLVFFGLSFLLCSGLLNAWIRAQEFGPQYAMTEVRYRIFSSLILALSYLAFVQILNRAFDKPHLKAVFQITAIIFGLGFWGRSWLAYVDAGPEIRNALVEKAITTKIGTGAPFYPDPPAAKRRLDDAERQGFYEVSAQSLGLADSQQVPIGMRNSAANCEQASPCYSFRIEELHNTDKGLYVRGWIYTSSALSNYGDVFLNLSDPEGQTVFPAKRTPRLDLARHGHGFRALRAGFMSFIPANRLRRSEFSISLAIRQPNGSLPWELASPKRIDVREYLKWSFNPKKGTF